jgi:heavy metal sensor kinase
MTIRTRLTFLYASLLAIAMILFSAATLSVLNWTMRRQVDNSLLKAATDIYKETLWDSADNQVLSDLAMMQINSLDASGLYVQVWRHDKRTGVPVLHGESWSMLGIGYGGALDPNAIGHTEPVRRDVMVNGTHMRVVTIPLVIDGELNGSIQAGQSLRIVDAAIDRLLKIMLIGGALTLLASLLIGDYLTQRALRPIDTIAHTAQQITRADDLSRRIPYDGPPDELGLLTQTFNETLERLERLFNAQRRFVADVSHEMRTPLTTIRGNVDLMRRFGHDQEAMDAIESEAKRMSRLVEDLLLLAKADAGRLPLDKARIELDTLLLEIYNQAHLLNQHVTVNLGEIEQAQVIGDADRLKQLLLNLVTNALKYTPAGGQVTLSMGRQDQQVWVSVADTGIGIPAKDLPHIFDRFYRVDKARSRMAGGTGLGLSIARWIADAHGGQLSVVSEESKGSTFTITLPVAPPQVPRESIMETVPSMAAVRVRRSSR